MIVFTTKLTRRKLVSAVLVICILICSCFVFFRNSNVSESISVADESENQVRISKIKTNKDRVALLESYGWKVDEAPLETMEVRIPAEFEGVYEEYNELQEKQGFELGKYCGKKVMRYTYRINNYKGEDNVVANIIVYKNKLIAGDVCSSKMGGFMHGLDESSATSTVEPSEADNEDQEGKEEQD